MRRAGGGFAGYWAETPYVEHHHVAQEPWRIALDARRVGGAHPDLDRPFAYCDIGCGRGYTLLALAAAIPHGAFHGIDPNPDHIAEARRLAAEAGLDNVRFHEGAAEALAPDAVPPCDFVAAYGVFSWVAPDVAENILAFIGRILKPEGLILASLNLEAGWAQALPVRRRLRAAYVRAEGAPRDRLRAAVAETRRVFGPGGAFAERNPTAAELIAKWPYQPLDYIPHELMNDTWRLFSIAEAFAMFEADGFTYAGARLRSESEMREKYADLIEGDNETEIEDRLSAARAERFRSLVFRRAGGPPSSGGMIVPQGTRLGAAAPRALAGLIPEEALACLDPAGTALLERVGTGLGVSLAEVLAAVGKEARLKLFATLNQLVRAGDLVEYRAPPAEAGGGRAPAPLHPLTPLLLRNRHAIAVAAHVPSPVLGGGVRLPGPVAALLRAHLDGAEDPAATARALYREAVEAPGFWAVESAEIPREIPDFEALATQYRAKWTPFLQRMRVLAPD